MNFAPHSDVPVSREASSKRLSRVFLVLAGACALAACSAAPGRRVAGRGAIDPRYGVAPSPKVVADGEEVPRGGGYYMVGKPYQIGGRTYYPNEKPYSTVGLASWYGSGFHGRKTANGEVFDLSSVSAAHPTMPLPSYARVTNLRNARSMIVRVNDRGPYHGGRIMDVSQRVAQALDFHRAGTARIRVDYVGRADLEGDDSETLLATLRDDGQPAAFARSPVTPTVALASAPEARRPALSETAEPEQVAALIERSEKEGDDVGARRPSAQVLAMLQAAPPPPQRPFDLGASGPASFPLPPRSGMRRGLD